MAERIALLARVAVPWRHAMVAALLSMLLGVVLEQGLATERHTSAPPPTRFAGAPRERLSSLPAPARAPVSAALGSADPRYRVSAFRGGFQAVNPGQRLRVRFERSGVRIGSGAAWLALHLDGVGYGRSPRAAGDVLSHVQANRVAYTGEGLSEWYANGPLGLEQGFTVSRPAAAHPSGPSAGLLTLSMTLSGDVHAALAPGGKSVLLSSRGGSSLRYGDLLASDAQGHTLRSWMVLHAGRILLRVDTRGARYPLRIDPLLTQQVKLVGAGKDGGREEEQGEGLLGASVAMSADGETALIGAPDDDNGVGAAWVFTRTGATWTQQGPKLTGGGAGGTAPVECEIEEPGEEKEAGECGFGESVALSADGDTALVGGPGDSGTSGAVWVFTRSEATWMRQGQPLTVGNEPKGHFGRSVALSGDGDTAVIGAPGATGYTGAVWVFTRSGTSWGEPAKLLPAGESREREIYFGRSVAVSGDGETLLIGAPGVAGRAGAAWVFTREGTATTWSEQEQLVGHGESEEGRFGYSVALSGDGATALVGERAHEDSTGAAWVFTREGTGTTWREQQELTAGGEAGSSAKFGYSVALSADGATALIGDPRYSGSPSSAWMGAAWVFTRSDLTFGSEEMLTPAKHGKGWLGASVALSESGEAALIGAPRDSGKLGAAWSFAVPEPPPVGEGPGGEPELPKEGGGGEGTEPVEVTGGNGGGKEAGGGNEAGDGNGAGGASVAGHGAVLAAGPTSGPACGVSLRGGKSITVHSRGRAALELIWTGKGSSVVTCRGRLTLRVKVEAKGSRSKRSKTQTIGAAGFSIGSALTSASSGKTKVITIKLDAAGRALLSATHGRLAARLTILVSSPAPPRTQTHAVYLVLRPARPRSISSTS